MCGDKPCTECYMLDPEAPIPMDPCPSVDSSTGPLLLDPSLHATDFAIAEMLLSIGIQVDPTFNLTICLFCWFPISYQSAHPSYISNHKPVMRPHSSIPPRDETDRMLLQLKANQTKPIFPRPIPSILGLEMFNTVKCQIPWYLSTFVFFDRRRFNEHCLECHHGAQRVFAKVKAHKLCNMHTTQQMVEVILTTTTSPELLLDDLEKKLSPLQLCALPDVFQPSSKECSKGTLFAPLGWGHLLVAVCIRDLQGTVITLPILDPYNCYGSIHLTVSWWT